MSAFFRQDPYAVLGLPFDAPETEVKASFRKLALDYHPDRNPSSDAKLKLQRIYDAYEKVRCMLGTIVRPVDRHHREAEDSICRSVSWVRIWSQRQRWHSRSTTCERFRCAWGFISNQSRGRRWVQSECIGSAARHVVCDGWVGRAGSGWTVFYRSDYIVQSKECDEVS
eukprot:TRINITY_DN3659_c0_g1_i3.p1 TRINITY_DN3659_c0_g1~~TRINITY_DN3659_c0_g1_i3.p1  ORF type:complete len:169 (+),score=5.58 TRINITY_DN3659_c0_g1_i3:293-799(+)